VVRDYQFFGIPWSCTLLKICHLHFHDFTLELRRVWGYQRGNQNPYIEEVQTLANKVQKDKQRSIKHTHKTKDRVARV